VTPVGSPEPRAAAHDERAAAGERTEGVRFVPGQPDMWVFVLFEALVFTSYFTVYVVRRTQSAELFLQSQAHLDLRVGVFNTLVLLVSSWSVARCVQAAREGSVRTALTNAYLTMLFGFVFLVSKVLEWATEIDQGFSFTTDETPKRRIAPKAVVRFKERVRELTRRTRGVSIERMAQELARYLRGWIGYFGNCETASVLRSLEQWTRRRLRSAIWKQWKHGRTRFAELRKRGVGQDLAAKATGSAHGPWQLANSPALAIALPNAYFASLGIPSLTACR